MAVVANATTTTSAASVIYPQFISPIVRRTLGRIPTIYQLGVIRVDLRGRNSDTYRHTLRDQIARATTLAETDEVVSTEITRAHAEVSTDMKAVATFVSDQADVRSLWAEGVSAIEELTRSCARAIDLEFVNTATGFSAPIGDAATAHTVQNLVELFTTWRARVGSTSSKPLLCMHGDAMRDLQQDAVSNAAAWFGTEMGVQLHDATNGLNQGVVTTFGGVDMVVSDDMPVGDTTGWSNMMIARGDQEGVITMPFEHPIEVEMWREPKRKGTWFIGTVNYGVGEVNDLAGQTFITRT